MTGLAQNLSFILLGEDKSASSTMTGAQKTAEKVTSAIGGSFQKLGGIIGGEFGNIISEAGTGIEELGAKGVSFSKSLAVAGGITAAAGVGLMQLGSGIQQATDQLTAAQKSAGESTGQYSEQIEKAVASGENFGHSAIDTKSALTTLVEATGSTSTALDHMGVVTDLAAAKHETLAEASTQVTRILAGSGARTLVQYGIHMDGIGSKTEQGSKALEELSKKLDGQASASVNNFGAQVGVARTKLIDWAEEAAGPAGQILTGFGTAAGIAGTVVQILQLRQEKAAASQLELNAAVAGSIAPLEGETAAAGEASAASGGLGGRFGSIAKGAAVAGGALAAATVILGLVASTAETAASNTQDFEQTLDKTTGAVTVATKASVSQKLAQEGAFQAAKQAGVSQVDLTYAVLEGGKALDAVQTKITGHNNAMQAAYGFNNTTGESLYNLNKQLEDGKTEWQDSAAATDGLATSLSVAGKQAQLMASAVGQAETSLSTYGKTAQTAESSTEAYYTAVDAATTSIKTNGQAIDDQTSAGRANNQSLYAVAAAANAVAEANLKNKTPLDQVISTAQTAQANFITLAENMGYTADQANTLAQKLIEIPTSVNTTVTTTGLATAMSQIDLYNIGIGKIPGSVTTNLSSVWAAPTKHAQGGDIMNTQYSLVGENGPEIVGLPGGSHVYPTGSAPSSNQGAINITVNVSGGLSDDRAIAKAVTTALTNATRQGSVSRSQWQEIVGV